MPDPLASPSVLRGRGRAFASARWNRSAQSEQSEDASQPYVQPAEARTFSIVEQVVLIAGFGCAGGFMSYTDSWPNRVVDPVALIVSVLLYLSIGLGLSGPILVSWRERLGKRRAIWGLGEALWFATGILVQVVVLTVVVIRRFGPGAAAVAYVGLMVALPVAYLTGNPVIQIRRAPLSWSNLVGLVSVMFWILTIVAIAKLNGS